MNFKEIYENYNINNEYDDLIEKSENELEVLFKKHEKIAEYNQYKVLKAFNFVG